MGSLDEMNKAELLAVVKDLVEKVDSSREKMQKFEEFFNANFIDGEGLSNQSKITSHLATLDQHVKKTEEIKDSLLKFNEEMLIDVASKESTRTVINKLLAKIKPEQVEIAKFHKSLFTDDEEKDSIKTEIEELKTEISKYHKEVFSGDATNEPLKAQFDKLHKEYGSVFKEAKISLESLKKFYVEVFGGKDENTGKLNDGLKKSTETLKDQLSNLINETTEKLHAITDSSLHNSFYLRAESHTDEYEKLQRYTFQSVISIAGVTIVFAIIQMINIFRDKPFSYQIAYYQLGITLPIIYVVWMFNRNQKIAKKLAEEYHHKAALSEAMTGYRGLYNLKHDSDEYMNLFNGIKEQLNVNPSTKIDKFLNLKSPQEDLLEKGTNLMNPEKIGDAVVEVTKNVVKTKTA